MLDILINRQGREATPLWANRPNTAWIAAIGLLYVGFASFYAPGDYAAFFKQYSFGILQNSGAVLSACLLVGTACHLKARSVRGLLQQLKSRLLPLALVIFGMMLLFSAYTALKFNIPLIVPFYADQAAADIDAALHGRDVWQWAHAVWPADWSVGLAIAYGRPWLLYWLIVPAYIVLFQSPDLIAQYALAFILKLVICGTLLALAFSSVGPIFYYDFLGDSRFLPLIDRLEANDGMSAVLATADYLLQSHQNRDGVSGSGISAIPSMHVAAVTLNAWVLSRINPWAGSLAWAYFALILFGSVYTGWHYAIDGYVSFITVTLIWFACGRGLRTNTQEGQPRRRKVA